MTIVPTSRPPSIRALMIPTMIGKAIGINAGASIDLIAEPVTMSIARPYSGRSVPSMIPGCSRNWRRTSSTTSPPTRPTASMASDANRNGIRPPMKRPEITQGSDSENESGKLPAPVIPVAGVVELGRVRVEQDERREGS